jgi:prostamide/prostaglandin F2alpha synthase
MPSILDFKNEYIGGAKTLGDLWTNRPVLLVFLRRLGCSICRAYVEELKEQMEEITEYANVAFLSFEEPGTGSDVDRSFAGVWSGPVHIISKKVYKQLFGRKTFFDGLFGLADMDTSLVKKHGTKGNLSGDGFQLGGQFIVSKSGEVLLDHRQTRYGDDTPVEKILKVLRAASAP